LVLRYGLAFEDLYARDGLVKLDAAFIAHLQAADIGLHNRLVTARRDPDALERKAESDLLVDVAPHLEDFIAELFGIGAEMRALQARHDDLAPIYTVKRLFVQRRAVKGVTPEAAAELDGERLARELAGLFGEPLSEQSYARHVAGRLDMVHLVPVETEIEHGVAMLRLPPEQWRQRAGFALTDPGTDLTGALDQANYCIWCHNQGKDSCSRGLRDKKSNAFQKSVFGVILAGCPLEEKISEMN